MIRTFRLCINISLLVLLSACSGGETPLPFSPTSIPATQTATITATVTVTPSPLPNRLESTETPELSKRTGYHDPGIGIGLQYPTGWNPVKPGRLEGLDGFFELNRFESIASHLDFISGGLDYRLTRACDWEVNLDPRRYGRLPFVRREYHSTFCIIKPGAGADIPFPTAILYAPTGGFAMLRADAAHFDAMVSSLVFDWPDGVWPWPDFPQASGTAPEEPVLETRQIGQLTADIYRLHRQAEEHLTADYMEMQAILGPVLDKNQARRKTWNWLDSPQKADWLTQKLAPLGYTVQVDAGNHLNLYHNGALAVTDIDFFEPAVAEVNGRVVDFALVVENQKTGGYELVRKDGTFPWDWINVKRWRSPIFLGDVLLSVEVSPGSEANHLLLKKEDEVIYTYISSMPNDYQHTVTGLHAWEDRWVLEISGTLVIDGVIQNTRLGYGEIFGWQLLDGKPFFFFEKNGKIGINYDGKEQNLWFPRLLHDNPCATCVIGTISGNDQLVWFWAWEDGAFYYVEVGK